MSASRNHLERCHDLGSGVRSNQASSTYVSLEAEIPEVLYRGMKDFIGSHPNWDQYRVMSSALAHFLFQNCHADVGQQAPSTTRTLGQRQRRFWGSTTLLDSDAPMAAPPTSWM